MRMSQLFFRTYREAPSDAESDAYKLVARTGLARQIASGVFSFMPLGWRVMRRIEEIIRQEMEAIGGQEVHMPVLQPAELWQESGRYNAIGSELFRLKDRNKRDFVLAMTHEEAVTEMARGLVNSYRQLPFMLFQIQTKERDEPRPRGGLMRLREFTMKDAYSFHETAEDLDRYYPLVVQAYLNIFRRCGLNVVAAEADSGMMGGNTSHEFILISETGEDQVVTCPGCGYAANLEAAVGKLMPLPKEKPEPMEAVATPNIKSISDLTEFFHMGPERFLKTMVFSGKDGLVAAAIRGDLEVNLAKLAHVSGQGDLQLADEDTLIKAGLVQGFVSPVGLKNIKIIADTSVTEAFNFVAGGNKVDTHIKNVVLGRDFKADQTGDIAEVAAGQSCTACGQPLRIDRGIELGHTFKLGLKYSATMGATFQDKEGASKPIVMGCYGIGLDRLLQSVVDANHDAAGIMWPAEVAPYHVAVVSLNPDGQVTATAEKLYQDLKTAGFDVLYDDRAESAGVKLKDADLIGLPVRIVVSPKTLKEGQVEVKPRNGETSRVALAEALQSVKDLLKK
ncbi:MAG: proline--tRNA ligase [Bacillota bacterium]|jgi:prolyl-tRNA synthetase